MNVSAVVVGLEKKARYNKAQLGRTGLSRGGGESGDWIQSREAMKVRGGGKGVGQGMVDWVKI